MLPYRLIAAAKYLGVAPWDLAEQPAWWMETALLFNEVEGLAGQGPKKQGGSSGANGRRA